MNKAKTILQPINVIVEGMIEDKEEVIFVKKHATEEQIKKELDREFGDKWLAWNY
jgi:tRNA U54 and U55 pseudouridine synthase Pus10